MKSLLKIKSDALHVSLTATRRYTTALLATLSTLAPIGGAAVALSSCQDKPEPIPQFVDPYAGLEGEALKQKLHEDAEAYANSQKWSQGVKSLAAGVIDYYYYYPDKAAAQRKEPLILLSYHVDVQDFINKIEADAKARGTYDPKTEGVFQASAVSLEGDAKQNTWFVPSSAVYEAKNAGKTNLVLEIGKYPSPSQGRNTLESSEGLKPVKQMQMYSSYGIRLAKKDGDRIGDQEKQGLLKDIQ